MAGNKVPVRGDTGDLPNNWVGEWGYRLHAVRVALPRERAALLKNFAGSIEPGSENKRAESSSESHLPDGWNHRHAPILPLPGHRAAR